MENFDPKPAGVKEKNLYIVHLDTPRIIILSSVVIGIITASFLFGMSFIKQDKSSVKNLAVNDISFDENREIDVLNKRIPDLSDDSIEDSIPGGKTGFDVDSKKDIISGGDNADFAKNSNEQKTAVVKLDGADVLTKENISEIIPDAAKVVKAKKQNVKKDRIVSREKTVKVNKKIVHKKTVKKNKEIAVAAAHKSTVREVSREAVTHNSRKGYFSVQVASYDRLSKAEHEKSQLKSQRFDAFIDRTVVRGKNFYRVRIGPLSSKKRAIELLNDVQRDSRYANSYMVKE